MERKFFVPGPKLGLIFPTSTFFSSEKTIFPLLPLVLQKQKSIKRSYYQMIHGHENAIISILVGRGVRKHFFRLAIKCRSFNLHKSTEEAISLKNCFLFFSVASTAHRCKDKPADMACFSAHFCVFSSFSLHLLFTYYFLSLISFFPQLIWHQKTSSKGFGTIEDFPTRHKKPKKSLTTDIIKI